MSELRTLSFDVAARRRRVIARPGFGALIVLLAFACAAFVAIESTASAAVTAVSSFDKRGTDRQNGSPATAGGAAGSTAVGDTIDWVLSYRNTTGSTADVTIGDPISGDQSFVGGSLRTPPRLSPQWSTNHGSSYVGGEPGSGVDAIGASGSSVDGSTGIEVPFTPPLSSFRAGTAAGDGFEAIFIGGNIYNVFHHRAGALSMLDCHDKTTGAECPDFPVQYVSPTAGVPFTDNADAFGTGDNVLMTPSYNSAAYDPATGRIWFAAGVVNSTSIGVACADVLTMRSCGYTQLGTAASPNTTVSGGGPNLGGPGMTGGKQLGSKYYTLGTGVAGAPVFCFDTSTGAPCAGWPAGGVPSDPAFAPGPAPAGGADSSWLAASLESWGGYLVTSVLRPTGPSTYARDLGCIVAATGAPCSGGFPVMGYLNLPPADIGNYTSAPILDASGSVTGICGQTSTNASPGTYACYDLNGRSVGGAPWGQMVPNATVGLDAINAPLQIGARLYFAYSNLPRVPAIATYACWDFATNSECVGFVKGSSGADVRPYTLRQDPDNPDCIWELGDAGIFEVFSATFGGNPPSCNAGSAEVRLTPAEFYCDGGSNHVTGWNQVQVGGLPASAYDALAVTIRDANGNPVPGWTNRIFRSTEVPIDISSIPYSGSTRSLTVSIVISWGAHPVRSGTAAATVFAGDAPQICFSTRVGSAQCAAPQTIDNDATAVTSVAGGPSDAPGGNRSGSAAFTLPRDPSLCVADVKIRKTAPDRPVIAGRTLTYTLEVTNDGPDAAENVRVSDPLPGSVSFISASDGCTAVNDDVTCDVGTLAKGTSRTFEIRTRVASSLAHCPRNVARVTSTTRDPNIDNNVDSVCPPIRGEADLSITKSPSATQVATGGQVMYTLVVTNHGPSDATGVTVEDPMAPGLKLLSATPAQGRCSTAGGKLSCSLGSLEVGGSTQILVTAQAPTTVTSVVNTATVTGDQHDPNQGNNRYSARVSTTTDPAPRFDLAVTKTVNRKVVVLGEPVTYRIVVVNTGPDAAPDARLTDTFTSRGSVVSVRTTVGRCGRRIPLTCSFGTLRAGAKVTVTVVFKPTALGSGKRNTASVTGRGNDTNPRNNVDSATIAVRKVGIKLTKLVDRTVIQAGGRATYTIGVSNPTKGVAHRVQVCDSLPSGLVYVSASPKARVSHGRYCWAPISQLGPGRSRTYRITVRALHGTAGRKTNTATASSPDAATARARRTIRVIAGGVLGADRVTG